MAITRRALLATLPAFATSLCAQAQFRIFGRQRTKQEPAVPPFVYFGTDTDKGVGKGIYLARFDAAKGELTAPVLVAQTVRPAYFALGPERAGQRILYVGNEGATPRTAAISSFAIDRSTGMLRQLGTVPTGAVGPCYVSIDVTGQAVFVADYAGSAVSSHEVLANGTLSPPVDLLRFNNRARYGAPGPRKDRQDAAHPHSCTLSPDNRFVLVNDLGTDRIWIFPFTPETAKLGEPSFFQLKAGSGPRHIAFHPNGRWVYGIDELANRIDQYLWTATHGTESQALLVDTAHSVSTIAPHTNSLGTTAAEVAISSDGLFLYASNRAVASGGEDTLAVFNIHPETGVLKLSQRISCGGAVPRHFTLDPTERWLICGNQNSANVTVFARDQATGKLAGPVQSLALDSVMFTLFA